ncbi:putative alkaline phosphatase synthesis transcriptional regulatory protein PhoP [Desulfosarcina cetonica]|uniref:response regulator transcription factor n=1 Tax=Desulfosarcina cetonica TaxID=90730 RepID=UPI0006D27978|nr:response regulator transcription factor [Desulfosarcina cetonica]VTR69881.1 putative alkaline phosphatase synthesis transcriptional regulatory protein PhoP [Desulfosarcina cetonica]
MDKPQKRILIIEDDLHIAEGIQLNLTLQGYEVFLSADGVSGLNQWKAMRPDLIILDIMLPGIDGLSILQSIRLEDERLPVLILSAKGDPDDRIKGLALGVDDYLAKPFNLEELLLRVERLLKRGSWGRDNGTSAVSHFDTYAFGDNRIDFKTHTARCRMGEISLTEQEVKVLKLFITHRGKPLSRDQLLQIGWGYSRKTSTRTVDNFIVRFRKYFEDDPRNPVYFKSLRSIGYLFDHTS